MKHVFYVAALSLGLMAGPGSAQTCPTAPNHIAALSGRALTLVGLGRTDDARKALAAALALNPWLPERGLAGPGGPLEPEGKDI